MATASPTKTAFLPFFITGAIAGVLLACLHSTSLTPTEPLRTFFIAWIDFYSIMFLLAYKEASSLHRALLITLIPSFLASLPCFWTAHTVYASWCLLFIAAYALNAFHLHYQRHTFSTLHYSTLFYAVWDTFASLLITLFFAMLCWILLGICAGLFSIVNIVFLKNLILKTWFSTGITAFFICAGLYIPAQADNVVRNVRTILLLICQYLLIPLAIIGIAFIVLFALSDHQKTLDDSAQYLFCSIAFLSVLFLNGVYQDGMNEKEYPHTVKLICRVFIAITPIFSFLAIRSIFFGSDNAIHSSGINTENFYSLVNMIILFAYNLWYAIKTVIPNSNDHWLKPIEKANTILAISLIAINLIISMPVLYQALPKRTIVMHLKPTPYPNAQPLSTPTQNDGTWVDATAQSIPAEAFVFGENQGPIYVCKATIQTQLLAGTVQHHACTIASNKKIVTTTQFTVYVEPSRKVYWSTFYPLADQSRRLNVGTENNPAYICRTIYHNRVQVGVYKERGCVFIDNQKIIHSQDIPQYLYLNNR